MIYCKYKVYETHRASAERNNIMALEFKNENGREYTVLNIEPFNEADKEYYKNSWQQYRVALLEDKNTQEYVVASFLGNADWGSGYYVEDREQAEEEFNRIVENYRG